jgi:hypothetical protein
MFLVIDGQMNFERMPGEFFWMMNYLWWFQEPMNFLVEYLLMLFMEIMLVFDRKIHPS